MEAVSLTQILLKNIIRSCIHYYILQFSLYQLGDRLIDINGNSLKENINNLQSIDRYVQGLSELLPQFIKKSSLLVCVNNGSFGFKQKQFVYLTPDTNRHEEKTKKRNFRMYLETVAHNFQFLSETDVKIFSAQTKVRSFFIKSGWY